MLWLFALLMCAAAPAPSLQQAAVVSPTSSSTPQATLASTSTSSSSSTTAALPATTVVDRDRELLLDMTFVAVTSAHPDNKTLPTSTFFDDFAWKGRPAHSRAAGAEYEFTVRSAKVTRGGTMHHTYKCEKGEKVADRCDATWNRCPFELAGHNNAFKCQLTGSNDVDNPKPLTVFFVVEAEFSAAGTGTAEDANLCAVKFDISETSENHVRQVVECAAQHSVSSFRGAVYLSIDYHLRCTRAGYWGLPCARRCAPVGTAQNCVVCNGTTGAASCCDWRYGGDETCPLKVCTIIWLILFIVFAIISLILCIVVVAVCLLKRRKRTADLPAGAGAHFHAHRDSLMRAGPRKEEPAGSDTAVASSKHPVTAFAEVPIKEAGKQGAKKPQSGRSPHGGGSPQRTPPPSVMQPVAMPASYDGGADFKPIDATPSSSDTSLDAEPHPHVKSSPSFGAAETVSGGTEPRPAASGERRPPYRDYETMGVRPRGDPPHYGDDGAAPSKPVALV